MKFFTQSNVLIFLLQNGIQNALLKKWKVPLIYILFIAALAFNYSLPAQANGLKGDIGSHDPSALIKDGNKYWQFTTGDGIYSAYSYDLISWTAAPQPVFPFGTWPAWINSVVPDFEGHFWAPDMIYMNGLYHLYYSVSSFGSSRSAIGLVTNPTLDPNNPNFKWTDRGMVVSSDGSSTAYNAIDPAMIRDTDGRVYMSYGSFFGGLVVVEIDPSTGKVRNGSPTTKLAGGNHSDWEAPYIIKEGNYYYFYANRGSCCRGENSTYTIVMGRSTNIRGPYYDMNGVDLNHGGGSLVLGHSGKYRAPGHVGLLRENGTNFVSIHYYDLEDNGHAKLDIINLGYHNGWPFLTRDWLASGQYSVENRRSGKYMDPWGCTGELGQMVAQGDGFNSYCQPWNFTPLGDGVYRISTPLSGRVLDVYQCNPDNGTKLNLWDWYDNDCQKFKVQRAADGSHVFTSLTGNRVVEIPGGSSNAGVQLALWDYNGRAHQKWNIRWIGANENMRLADKSNQDPVALSSDEVLKNYDLNIYPNPSKDGNFNIQLGENFHQKNLDISILDMSGKKVYHSLVEGSRQLKLHNDQFKSGVYFLLIKSEGETFTNKLMVIK